MLNIARTFVQHDLLAHAQQFFSDMETTTEKNLPIYMTTATVNKNSKYNKAYKRCFEQHELDTL